MNRTFAIYFGILTINFFMFLSLAKASTQELILDEDSNLYDETDAINGDDAGSYDTASNTSSNSYKAEGFTNDTQSESAKEEDNEGDGKDHDADKNWEEANKFVNDVKGFSDNFPINKVGESTPYAVNSDYVNRSPAIVERSGSESIDGDGERGGISGNEETLEIDTED